VQLTIAEYAPRRVFVHAGVVAWKGAAILIPGLSYSGKTTLVSELIRAGATYYSDEYAVIDERGRVHAYPRALGVRSPSTAIAAKVEAKEFGGDVGTKPLRTGLVISTSFKERARWRPRELTRGKGVLEMLSNTVSARTQPELALNVLPKALEGAKILKGVRGEARDIVDSILEKI
jgi:serine kinase of HPr protein (carbohydrate metabolism regulator)